MKYDGCNLRLILTSRVWFRDVLEWDDVNIDFVGGYPRTWRQHDLICVIVDRITRKTHFIPINATYRQKTMQSCILRRLWESMEFPFLSFRIGLLSLLFIFGRYSKVDLVPRWNLVPHFINKWMVLHNWDDHLPLIEIC